MHYVLDGFNGNVTARLEGHIGLEKVGLPNPDIVGPPRIGASGQEVSWTPDGRFVLSGSADGKVHIWDVNPPNVIRPERGETNTITPIKSFDAHGSGPSRIVGFNHKLAMMVTGGNELAFWLPDGRELAAGTVNLGGNGGEADPSSGSATPMQM